MQNGQLDILLVAGEGTAAGRLEQRLHECTRPSMTIVRVHDLAAAAASATDRSFDLLLLDHALFRDPDRGLALLPIGLHTLPIVLMLPQNRALEISRALPDGIADYIVLEQDDPHVLERLLYYASQRHATVRSLREAESQLRAIVESMSEGVLIVDANMVVLYANPEAETVISRPLAQILGAPVGFDVPDEPHGTVEVLGFRHDPVQLDVQSRDIAWEGRPARLLVVRDITRQVELENNLRRSRDEARRVANLKTAFMANMSHELRMPLASIIGFAQLIRDGLEQDEFREFAESIIEGGNRLLETITSVLDLTRLDANAVRAQSRPVAVESIVREAVGMLGALASRKKLPVRVVPATVDDTVITDPAALRRILGNLIGNAIKFTDEGEVAVITVVENGQVRIRIEDTGRGIDTAFLPQMFDEFTQESSGFDRSHEGSGLGLAITRRLCDLIDADIHVESEKGKGTAITVALPLADQSVV